MEKSRYLFITKKAIKRTHSKMIKQFNVTGVTSKDDRVVFNTTDIAPIKKHFDKIQIPLYHIPRNNMSLQEVINQEPI